MTWQQYFDEQRALGDTRLKSLIYHDWYALYGYLQQPPAPPAWQDSDQDR